MQLEKVVPLGRSFDEYRTMLALSEQDLGRKILGVGDGPASFNAEMASSKRRVVSVDPLYVFDGSGIEARFYAVLDDIMSQVKATPQEWVWTYHRSPDHLREHRIGVMNRFVADFDRGNSEGRYVAGELPRLPFRDFQFDLAVSSHFLFLYSDHYDYEFHRSSIYEMLRVSRDVRIFPLLTLMLKRSPHLDPLVQDLRNHGNTVKICTVQYQLQEGGNEMLQIGRGA